MAGYYETKTMLRAEFDEANKGTEAGLRVTYDQYLKNIGLNSEAEAIAQRAKEDAEGKVFGTQQKAKDSTVFGTATRADRKISDAEEAANQAAQASNDAQAAKQIIALSGGRITGNEAVYRLGTPEHTAYMKQQATQGKVPVAPDAYLDAQAFAARYMAYNRLGSNDPTTLLWDNVKKEFYRRENTEFFDPKISEPTVGMGTQWSALNQRLFAAPAGPQRDAVQQEIDEMFGRQIGYAPGSTIRDFPNGVAGLGAKGGFAPTPTGTPTATKTKSVASAVKDASGNTITKYNDGSVTSTDTSGMVTTTTSATPENTYEYGTKEYEQFEKRVSAYDLLFKEFDRYGLSSLVTPLKNLIVSGASDSEFTLKLRESEPYKKRFSANAQRVAKGLKSLSESEYIELEDQYQDVMRRYGLPDTYYARGEMGIQEGFNKFLEGDVSPVELEDRISTAQKRVLNANPEVSQALKQFYPDITNSDILAYTLDPKNAIENIKRKVTTAEIGGAAIQSGLQTGLTRAEQLRAAGVTKDTAQQGFGTIAGGLERGSQLASIYGEDPYTQTTAEEEVFSLSGATGAKKQRQKITGLEKATFGGQSGISSGALARDRAGAY